MNCPDCENGIVKAEVNGQVLDETCLTCLSTDPMTVTVQRPDPSTAGTYAAAGPNTDVRFASTSDLTSPYHVIGGQA